MPYGYRKKGSKGDARLVVCEELMAPIGMSEAEVIRMIFRMAGVEKQSCPRIADHLNGLGVPCADVRDGRLRGQQTRTSGGWRAGRVRNLLVSTTYKGQHVYGKRSRQPHGKLICRTVPATVSEQLW